MKPISFFLAFVLLLVMVSGCTTTNNDAGSLSTRPTTTSKENDPRLWETVYSDIDNEVYTVTDASVVFIDGKNYSKGHTYAAFGKHTLTYSKYNNEYSRELVFYRLGDVNADQSVNQADVDLLKAHLSKAKLDDAALHAADINKNGAVDNVDLTLLQTITTLENGLVPLAPVPGAKVMQPSTAVAEVMTDYTIDSTKSMLIKDGTQMFHRAPLLLVWVANGVGNTYTVSVGTKQDLSDATVYTTDTTHLTVYNLIPATTYYWKVTAGDAESDVGNFVTADTVRTLTIDGVDNTRDAGGWATEDGKVFRYGMIYRTASLDNITEAGRKELVNVLGVTTDLDLRSPGEGTAGSGSPLGEDINYINCDAPYYWGTTHGIASDNYRAAWLAEIRVFTDKTNYPMAVHCSVGRDRTGTILLVIKGLCGVSLEDIYLDFELSVLSEIGGTNASVVSLKNNLRLTIELIQESAPEGSFAEACEAYLLSIGITADEIAAIKSLLVA